MRAKCDLAKWVFSPIPRLAGALALAGLPAFAGQSVECRFDSQCLYDTGCVIFDAPIPMRAEFTRDGTAGAAQFDGVTDSFGAKLTLLSTAVGTGLSTRNDTWPGTRSYTLTDAADTVGLLTIHPDGNAMMSRHSASNPDDGALYSGFCRRS